MSPLRCFFAACVAALVPLASLRADNVHAEDDQFWAGAAALLPGFDGEPEPPGASDLDGRWGPVLPWPHTPVSAAHLPSGRILTFSGQEPQHWPGTKTQTYWGIWDPATGAFENSLYLDHEMFCAHLVMRTDGTLQTMGGRYTVRDSSTYDWRDNRWGRVEDMFDRRWYTTSVALPDGDVFTVSGSGGSNTAERYHPETDTWQRLGGINWQPVAGAAGFESHWWPYVFVAPDGELFHFGPTKEMHWVSPDGDGSRVSAGLQVPGDHYPKHAGVVMYDSGKFLVAGGANSTGGGTTRASYTVDLNTTPPTVQLTDPMAFPRRFQNAVALPNGEVLIVGGNTSGRKFSDQGTVLTPELWNPETGKWRMLADMDVPRNYHSIGMLLPDGRVLAAGGGYLAGNPNASATHTDGQIFTPPDLFEADGDPAVRPDIVSAPDAVALGSVFRVEASPDIKRFSMIRMMATTHGLSTDQRMLKMPFSESDEGIYQLVAHPNANVMVPGYWMLYGVAGNGSWSEASIIHVKETGDAATGGLAAEYFNGRNFDEPVATRTDHVVDFDYGSGSPFSGELGESDWSARWSGWLVPEFTGEHTLFTNSDDGVRLWIDGGLVIDNWTTHAAAEDSATLSLTAGEPVRVVLEHFEAEGDALIQLSWSGPQTPKSIIPARNLRTLQPRNEAVVAAGDRHEFFVDGELVAIGADWSKALRGAFQADGQTTLAVRATSAGDLAGLIGHFTVNGGTVATSADWKVATTAGDGWAAPGFDDSSWAEATEYGPPGSAPWGDDVSGLPEGTPARWIWSADRQGDGEVFFRLVVGGPRLAAAPDLLGLVGDPVAWTVGATAPESSELGFSADGLPDGLRIDPASGEISGVFEAEGGFGVSVSVTDQDGAADRIDFTWTVRLPGQGEGSFLREIWTGIAGADVADLLGDPRYPGEPTNGENATGFPVGANSGDDYGSRLRGYIHAPVSGSYRFWLAADDSGRLLLGSDEDPLAAEAIAAVNGATGVAEWDKFPEQESAVVELVGGQRYYFEVLHKEGDGDDHVNLAWQGPGDTGPVEIDASHLSPFVPNRAPVIEPLGDRAHTVGTFVSFSIAADDPDDDPVAFDADGLPPGTALDPIAGEIAGGVAEPGIYPVTVTVSDSAGATAATSFVWRVNPELAIAPPTTAPSDVAGEVRFEVVTEGGTAPEFRWNFGDGSAETLTSEAVVTHAFPRPGRYVVSLTGIDANGERETITFAQNVRPAPTPERPRVSQSVVAEAHPDGRRVWNVNPDNGSVAVHDVASGTRLAEIGVGEAPRSLAFAPDGALWVVNKRSDSISVIDPESFAVTATRPLPRASLPFGLVFSPDGSGAWVALEGTGELAKLDPSSGAILARIAVGPTPRHLSISHDGARVWVSRFVSPPVPGESTAEPAIDVAVAEVVRVDTAALAVEGATRLSNSTVPDSPGGGRGVPNYLGPTAISPAGDMAWVPSKLDNIFRGTLRDGRGLTHDNTVRAITSFVDLGTLEENPDRRVDHDDGAVPVTALFGPHGLYVFVALEGSREVAVIDAYGSQELFRIDVGRAPQGLALSTDGRELYTHNFTDRSVTAHDISALVDQGLDEATPVATLGGVADEALDPEVLLGKQLFYDAADPRLARESYVSCAACHNDGGHDGRVWDMTGFGEGLRNTIELNGRGGIAHGPLHWSANFDEVQDFESQIRGLSGGEGLISPGNPHPPLGDPNAGRGADLDALAAYITSLDAFERSPDRTVGGELTAAAERGRDLFVAANCASCHEGEAFTDSGRAPLHDIGTLTAASGGRLGGALDGLDTPTLRGLVHGAPYLHDGSAATLAEAVRHHDGVSLEAAEVEDLVAYLKQIEDDESAAPAPTAPEIVSFTASRNPVPPGESTLLTWSVNDGGTPLTVLTVNGSGVLGDGVFSANPNSTTTYTLIATTAAGTDSRSLTVEVDQPEPAETFDAWATRFGLSGDAAEDSDGDSLADGLEFALGLDPTRGAAGVSTVPEAEVLDHRGLRMERTRLADGTRRFDLVFTRPADMPPAVGYWLEASLSLGSGWGIVGDLNGAGATDIPGLLDIELTDLGDGTEEVRAGFKFLDSAYLRLSINVGGKTVRSQPFGWIKRELHRKDNLVAPPFARAAADGGTFVADGETLTDTRASWAPGQWLGHYAHITSGEAAGAMLQITSNSEATLTFGVAEKPLTDRLAEAGGGSYVIRPCHTLAGLFGPANEAGLLSGDSTTADMITLANRDSSFSDYYFRSEGIGGTGWRSPSDPFAEVGNRIVPPADGLWINHPSEEPLDLFFHGEVVLGKRLTPVRSGIAIYGNHAPRESATLATLGVDEFFRLSPNGNNDSNLYLETSWGGLLGHYRKDDSQPGGTGWRLVFDDETDRGPVTFEPATAWLFFRFGEEGLWEREQPFEYAE